MPATPAADSSPFNFLAAGFANSAIPDFKTIAASLFAIPTSTTAPAPVSTKSASASKSAGSLLPRERKANKEKDAQDPELRSALLSMIPVSLPRLAPEAPNHAEPIGLFQWREMKGNSPAPVRTVPVVNQPQDSNPNSNAVGLAILQTSPFHNAENPGVHEETKQVAQVEPTPQQRALVNLQSATDNSRPDTDIVPNAGEISRVTDTKESVPAASPNQVAVNLGASNIDSHQTSASPVAQKGSAKIEKPVASTDYRKLSQAKQSLETEKNSATEANQTSTRLAADSTPQPQTATQQSIGEAVRAIIPQAVVLEHTVSGQAMGHSTNLHPTQSVKATGSKAGKPESTSTDVSAFSSAPDDKVSAEGFNTAKATPVVESDPKTVANKSKPDSTVKKAQRTSAEHESDASITSTVLHRSEMNAVISSQSTTSKNHDTVTPEVNIGSHAKSASAKNPPETSDLASKSTTQVPDADDIAPSSHAGVNTAKLVQGLTQSELRVGLQTRDFGNIDIRTSASHHEFSAQISVEHSEVARTLTTELPSLYARLNEQQVPVSNIHIHSQSLSTSSGLDQRSQHSSPQPQSSGAVRQQLEPTLPVIPEVFSSADRLDIRV